MSTDTGKPQARTPVVAAMVLGIIFVVVGVAITVAGLSGGKFCFGVTLALVIAGLGYDWYMGPKPR